MYRASETVQPSRTTIAERPDRATATTIDQPEADVTGRDHVEPVRRRPRRTRRPRLRRHGPSVWARRSPRASAAHPAPRQAAAYHRRLPSGPGRRPSHTEDPPMTTEPQTAPCPDRREDGHRRPAGRRRRRPDVRGPRSGDGQVMATRAARWQGGRRSRRRGRPEGVRRPQGLVELVGQQARPDARQVRRPWSRPTSRSWPSSRAGTSASRSAARAARPSAASLVFEYYAGAANKLFGETIPVSKPGLDFTLREPIGVVGLIVPVELPDATWPAGSSGRRSPPATRASSSRPAGRR